MIRGILGLHHKSTLALLDGVMHRGNVGLAEALRYIALTEPTIIQPLSDIARMYVAFRMQDFVTGTKPPVPTSIGSIPAAYWTQARDAFRELQTQDVTYWGVVRALVVPPDIATLSFTDKLRWACGPSLYSDSLSPSDNFARLYQASLGTTDFEQRAKERLSRCTIGDPGVLYSLLPS